MMDHATECAGESLPKMCLRAVDEGHKVLHIFPEHGSVRVALWQRDEGSVSECDVGPGPHARPSRHGLPSLRFAEEQDLGPDTFTESASELGVIGEGMHIMPLGPVRADVAEALRYEMGVLGDEIHGVSLRTGYKRRGVAQLMTGSDIPTALAIAERVTGTSNVAHALAFSLAVEDALDLAVNDRTSILRSALAECERLQSHLGDLAALAASTGTIVAAADIYRLREAVLRFGAQWTGHRYMRGPIAPGGWRSELRHVTQELLRLLDDVERQFLAVRQALDHTNSFLDRLHGAGRIPDRSLDLVGVVGRSAGLQEDVRWDRPYAGYRAVIGGRRPAACATGDAFGRYTVRCEEILASVAMLRRAGGDAPETAQLPPASGAGTGTGYGLVESPRGRLFYRVALEDGKVKSCRIRTASSINWVAVPFALANRNILQDFPIIDASFNLSVASLDL